MSKEIIDELISILLKMEELVDNAILKLNELELNEKSNKHD